MFRPSSDRLDYSKIMTPPVGYETVFAVGTTYSLDLDALIGISIALGLSESIDSGLKDNPIYLLEALQKTADKVLVFCEGGQIKAPANTHALHILLEKMVFQIVLRNNKSFHPKFWLIQYEDADGKALYRGIVLSRNLTFDRSWDIAVCLDGRVIDQGTFKAGKERSQPVRDFLISLLSLTNKDEVDPSKRKKLRSLADEILNVKFELNDKQFTDFEFCPVGIKGYDIDRSNLFTKFHELFIITPFLSQSIVHQFNELALSHPNRNLLITRKSELAKLKPDSVSNFDIYVLKDLIVDGEEAFSDGGNDEINDEKQKQDVHAKVYLKTKFSESELYLGSLNASHNACYGNVEFMLKLYTKKRLLNVEQMKKDIFGDFDKDSPFEKAEIKAEGEPEKAEADKLWKTIKEICRLKSYAKAWESDGKYSLEVIVEELPKLDNVFISPLLSNQEQPLTGRVVFNGLNMLQLSEFFVLKATVNEEVIKRVIKIKTDGLPEDRESAVVNSVVKNREGFIQYITFLLGDDYLLSMLENNGKASNSYTFGSGESIPALYEKMLKAAAHSPQKFNEIQRLMELLTDTSIIPEGFSELFEVFQKVVR